jgi:hypothetical protein
MAIIRILLTILLTRIGLNELQVKAQDSMNEVGVLQVGPRPLCPLHTNPSSY